MNETREWSNGYEECAGDFIRSRRPIGVARVREWSHLVPAGGTVLDLGCGPGVPISEVLIEQGLHVHAVDASPSMLAAFRSRFPAVPVECAPVEESSFFGMQFDGVLAWGLIFLLAPEAQRLVIGKAAAAVKDGGRLLFTAPAQVCSWNDVLTGRESVSLGRDEYVRLIEAAGLTVVGEFEDEGNNYYYSAIRISA